METKSRLLFLDQFRGLAILLMVFANALAHYERVPPYLQHAPADGFTLPDIVMPMFLFAMGYAAQLSFRSRVNRDGAAKTIGHFSFAAAHSDRLRFSRHAAGQRSSLGHSWKRWA